MGKAVRAECFYLNARMPLDGLKCTQASFHHCNLSFFLWAGVTYLDHAAATLYPQSLIRDYCQDISRNVYGEKNITWKQKVEIIITTALIPWTDSVVHVALHRKPSQPQPQQQTDAWHRGEGPIQVTPFHAPKEAFHNRVAWLGWTRLCWLKWVKKRRAILQDIAAFQHNPWGVLCDFHLRLHGRCQSGGW